MHWRHDDVTVVDLDSDKAPQARITSLVVFGFVDRHNGKGGLRQQPKKAESLMIRYPQTHSNSLRTRYNNTTTTSYSLSSCTLHTILMPLIWCHWCHPCHWYQCQYRHQMPLALMPPDTDTGVVDAANADGTNTDSTTSIDLLTRCANSMEWVLYSPQIFHPWHTNWQSALLLFMMCKNRSSAGWAISTARPLSLSIWREDRQLPMITRERVIYFITACLFHHLIYWLLIICCKISMNYSTNAESEVLG